MFGMLYIPVGFLRCDLATFTSQFMQDFNLGFSHYIVIGTVYKALFARLEIKDLKC
jgi:hypothetical protein